MISVIVTYRAKPGADDELGAALASYARIVRTEPGCLAFFVSRSTEDPRVFHLHEEYASTAALEAHKAYPHYLEFVTDAFLPRLEERTVHLAVPVGERG